MVESEEVDELSRMLLKEMEALRSCRRVESLTFFV